MPCETSSTYKDFCLPSLFQVMFPHFISTIYRLVLEFGILMGSPVIGREGRKKKQSHVNKNIFYRNLTCLPWYSPPVPVFCYCFIKFLLVFSLSSHANTSSGLHCQILKLFIRCIFSCCLPSPSWVAMPFIFCDCRIHFSYEAMLSSSQGGTPGVLSLLMLREKYTIFA